jgi:excisionase family DNA binding protein
MTTTTRSALHHDVATAPPLLVTIRQASAMLSISRSSIYLLIESGQLTPVRIGRSVRLPVDQLEQFVADRLTVADA